MDQTTDEILGAAVERMKRRQRLLLLLGAILSIGLFVAAILFVLNELREQDRRQAMLAENEQLQVTNRPPSPPRLIETIPTFAETIRGTQEQRELNKRDQQPGEDDAAGTAAVRRLLDSAPESPEELDDRLLQKIQQTVRQLANAESVEQQLLWLRNSEIIEPAYRQHLQAGNEVVVLQEVTGVRTMPMGWGSFVLAQAITKDGQGVQAIFEEVEDRFLLDWESTAHFDPVGWQEFREADGPPAAEFRVLATLSNTYAGLFNEREHVALRLEHPRESGALYGYFNRNDPQFAAVQLMLERSGEKSIPLFLRLACPGEEGRSQQMLVETILGEGWVRY